MYFNHYFAHVSNITYILSWKSRRLHDTKIKSIVVANYLLNPRINIYDMGKIRIKFNGSFLNRFPRTMIHRNVVNIYIVYEITSDYKDINYRTLENCLFGSVKLTKNANLILKNVGILDMVLDLIDNHLSQLVMKLVKM